MSKTIGIKAVKPNPALKPLAVLVGEMSKERGNWEKDLSLTYTRIP
jgi:hypothetical protein